MSNAPCTGMGRKSTRNECKGQLSSPTPPPVECGTGTIGRLVLYAIHRCSFADPEARPSSRIK